MFSNFGLWLVVFAMSSCLIGVGNALNAPWPVLAVSSFAFGFSFFECWKRAK